MPDGCISVKITLVSYKVRDIGTKKSNVESRANRPSGGGRSPAADEGASRGNLTENRPVARLSHDIRTQLYIIIGFAELMLDEIPGKINDEQRRNLNDVLNSGKRLLDLLHDIVAQSESK